MQYTRSNLAAVCALSWALIGSAHAATGSAQLALSAEISQTDLQLELEGGTVFTLPTSAMRFTPASKNFKFTAGDTQRGLSMRWASGADLVSVDGKLRFPLKIKMDKPGDSSASYLNQLGDEVSYSAAEMQWDSLSGKTPSPVVVTVAVDSAGVVPRGEYRSTLGLEFRQEH
jgi:hypothetical protein